MLKIVADHKIPFLTGALEDRARMVYMPGNAIAPQHVKDADALIIRTRTRCHEGLLKGSAVKFISSATIGYDHIDTRWCEENHIRWVNAPGCNSASVVQYVASALAFIAQREQKPLHHFTLGIVGVGHIGSRLAKLAALLEMPCLLNDPPRATREGSGGFTDLEQLLEDADIVTLHIPLEDNPHNLTRHLANERFFARMKKGSWFINTSRGETASTLHLKEALRSFHLAGAIVDVWENEPLIDAELLQMAQLATPHIAGYSADGKAMGTAMSVQAISRHFGLGLDDWFPPNIPAPHSPTIPICCLQKTPQQIFTGLCLQTYPIASDSQRLKASPDTFEWQRENYPLRREPGAYTLIHNQCPHKELQFLKKAGFKISG